MAWKVHAPGCRYRRSSASAWPVRRRPLAVICNGSAAGCGRRIKMKFDPEQLSADVHELLGSSVELIEKKHRRSYGSFRKTPRSYDLGGLAKAADDGADDEDGEDTGVHAHAEIKAEHHEKMAELYDAISSRHKKIAAHYSAGAQGAYGGAHARDDARHELHEDEGGGDAAAAAELDRLGKLAASGDYGAAVRLARLQRLGVHECLRRPFYGDPSAAAFSA